MTKLLSPQETIEHSQGKRCTAKRLPVRTATAFHLYPVENSKEEDDAVQRPEGREPRRFASKIPRRNSRGGIPLAVLVVEDSEDDVVLIIRELRRAGYDPICKRVDNSATMVKALEEQAWELVIADHAMPQFSASEALRISKRIRPDIPFLVVSGEISREDALRLVKLGAKEFLPKGKLRDLGALVRRALKEDSSS